MSKAPARSTAHDALAVFLGKWTASGTSYGGTDQSRHDLKANSEAWTSMHEGVWHTGKFFLVQDERADIAGKRFDTLSILGVNPDGDHFCRSFENHGFYRDYPMRREGDVWTLDGETERARIEFLEGGRKQTITWEWKPEGHWLPLCDRTAVRVE